MIDRSTLKSLGKALRRFIINLEPCDDESFYGEVGGACGIAAYTMQRMLADVGHRSTFHMCESDDTSHCWTTLNETVIDVTATQFDDKLPSVLIEQAHVYRQRWFVKGRIVINDVAVAKLTQWPSHQNPHSYAQQIEQFLQAMRSMNFR